MDPGNLTWLSAFFVGFLPSGCSPSQICGSAHRYAPYFPDILGTYAIWIFLGRSGTSGIPSALWSFCWACNPFFAHQFGQFYHRFIVVFPAHLAKLFPDPLTWMTWPTNIRAHSFGNDHVVQTGLVSGFSNNLSV
jgi:hypothetical protein